MGWYIGLIIALIFAVICYQVAGRRGHNQVLWAVLGFFFPLIALVVLVLIPERDTPATP